MNVLDLHSIARALGGEVSGQQVLAPGPEHSPRDRSLAVRLDPNAPDGFLVHSHAGDDWRGCRDHVRARLGLPEWQPDNTNKANGHARGDQFVAIYDYVDESGELLFQVCRKANKQGFPQRRPDGKGGWNWKTSDVRKVLYRLPELIEAIASGHVVAVAEGEKDVGNLWKIGVPATCSPGGASKPNEKPKWRSEYSESLRGADVVIIPDHDDPGYAHAKVAARMSAGIAARVRILRLADYWPECPEGGDVSDWLAAGHTREELDALIEQAPDWSPRETDADNEIFDAAELDAAQFAPVKSVVPGLVVEGLTLLCGKPKLGKSWLLLHAAYAIATGGFTLGDLHCIEGDVLYCSLEDTKRRLKSRMRKLFGSQPRSRRMKFRTKLPRLAEGGLDVLSKWIRSVPNPRLIAIDTLAMVRMPNRKDQSAYDADYAALIGLRELAHEFGVAIVLVHHVRKMDADDPFDTISGTLGLTASPDSIIVLKRDAAGTMLLARGRDIEEIEKAVSFDKHTCKWVIMGDADLIRRSTQQQIIIAALKEAGEPLTPTQVASHTGMKAINVRKLLGKMAEDGAVRKVGYGKYEVAETAHKEAA